MTDKHTPAPWFKVWNGYYWDIQDSPKRHAVSNISTSVFFDKGGANANLIAESPNMLKTLETIEYKLGQIDPVHYKSIANDIREVIKASQKAIAKARGES